MLMPTSPAALAALRACLEPIDWVLPDPGGHEWLWHAGRCYRRELFAEMREIAHELRLAGEGEPECRAAFIYEAVAAGLMGDFAGACDLFVESQAVNLGEALYYLNRGVLLVKLGELAAAAGNFAFAAELAADLPAPWAYLAILRSLTGDWQGAREAALEAIAREATCRGLVNLCLANACAALGLPIDPASGFPARPSANQPAAVAAKRFAGLRSGGAPLTVFVMAPADRLDQVQALVWSLKAASSRCGVHLHLVNPDERTEGVVSRLAARAAPLTVSWTAERLAAADADELRRRLRMVRLARLREFLAGTGGPVILADPQVLFRRAPESFLAPDAAQPIWLIHAEGDPLWTQYAGDLAAFAPGAAADALLQAAAEAADSALFQGAALEFLDQAALWAAVRDAPAGIVRPVELAATLDEARDGAWSEAADDAFRAALIAAAGDVTEPEPKPQPVNELLQSVFGPMLVNQHDTHIARAIRGRGGGEAVQEVGLLRQFIRRGDTVLDVGANVGTHTVPFCQAVGAEGRVHAFEPQRVIFQVMVANVALNSCLNAHCHLAAVGAKRGKLQLPRVDYSRPGNFGLVSFELQAREEALSLLPAESGDAEEVDVMTIDSLALAACHLLKIDVEGMEGAVLQGAKKTIAAHRPVIYMESFENDLGRAAIKLVAASGYRVFRHSVVGGVNVLCTPRDRDWGVVGLAEVDAVG